MLINRLKGDKKFVYINIVMIIMTVTLLGIGFFKVSFHQVSKYVDYTDNWYSNGEKVDLSKVEDYEYIEMEIPEIHKDTFLFFCAKSVNLNIFVNNRPMYQHDMNSEYVFGKTKGLFYVGVPLFREDSGKKIKIMIDAPYKDNSAKINYVRMGDHVPLLEIRTNLLTLILSCLVVLIGLLLVILFPFLWYRKLTTGKTLFLGLFVFCIGTFLASDCNVLQVIYGKEEWFHIVSELFMQIAIVPFILFVSRIYTVANKRGYQRLCVLSILIFMVTFLLNIFEIKDLHETIFLVHLNYLFVIVYSVYLMIKAYLKNNKVEKEHNIGFIILFLFVILDVVSFYSGFYTGTSFFTRIGVLLFLIMEIFIIAKEYLTAYKNNMKHEFLSKLAYHDGLTELYNRTSFTEDMSLEKKDGFILVFDVNNLKTVNDGLGHSYGGELIITVSNFIRDYYTDIGNCYRIGGDEFVVITNDDATKDDVDIRYKKLCESLDYINRTQKRKYTLSVAMGYQSIKSSKNMDDAFNKADSKMYKNKIKMKKGKK